MNRKAPVMSRARRATREIVAYTIICGLTMTTLCGWANAASGSDVIAIVGNITVNRAALQERTADRLLREKTEEYNAEMAALNEYIDELLLSREAARRNLGVTELLQREVNGRVPEVTETEARAVVENGSVYQGLPLDQALRAATAEIRARRTAKRRAEYVASLRSGTSVEIRLEPPRLQHPISGGRTIGSADAPVSIVEFSDFQCPYCAALTASLTRLRTEYPSKIRLTFKQFPLPMHPQAAKAAEASLCAAEQDRFWQMHDLLFNQQNTLAEARFSDIAEHIGINVVAFEKCVDSRKFFAEVNHDHAEAIGLGLTATPSLFINGRLLVGTKPYEALRAIIDDELKRINQ